MFSGPHISTWMKKEIIGSTLKSIIDMDGKKGTFFTQKFAFIKAHNAILLVVKGINSFLVL